MVVMLHYQSHQVFIEFSPNVECQSMAHAKWDWLCKAYSYYMCYLTMYSYIYLFFFDSQHTVLRGSYIFLEVVIYYSRKQLYVINLVFHFNIILMFIVFS